MQCFAPLSGFCRNSQPLCFQFWILLRGKVNTESVLSGCFLAHLDASFLCNLSTHSGQPYFFCTKVSWPQISQWVESWKGCVVVWYVNTRCHLSLFCVCMGGWLIDCWPLFKKLYIAIKGACTWIPIAVDENH